MDSYWGQHIYNWLNGSELDLVPGLTSSILNRCDQLMLDASSALQKLDAILVKFDYGISIALFFGLLWFAMQFVQKRWYTS